MDAEINRSTWFEKLVCRDGESWVVVRAETGEPEIYNRISRGRGIVCCSLFEDQGR